VVRFGSALVTVLVFIGASYAGGAVFAGVLGLLVWVGLVEFWGMAQAAGLWPAPRLGTLAGLGVYVAGVAGGPAALLPALMAALALVLVAGLRDEPELLPGRLGVTMLGICYVAVQVSFMGFLRLGPAGYGKFAFFFAVIQMADAFAFFGGRAWGRHRLAPALSPGKTWEGVAVGLAAALFTAWLFAFALPGLALPTVLALGAALFASSLLGDLVASSFKRAAGLKDFGRLLPEQGGLLDRFDGYLFSAPLAYYLLGL
jgi:phosphatidate cytidylyltransferase